MPKYGSAAHCVRFLLSILLLICATIGCNRDSDNTPPSPPQVAMESDATDELSDSGFVSISQDEIESLRPAVTKFCADCHMMPLPSSSSIADWKEEVEQGFMLYRTSGRSDLEVPDQETTLAFFQSQASENLDWSNVPDSLPACDLAFSKQPVQLASTRAPGVSNIRWIDLGMQDSPALVYCNINTGGVIAHWPQAESRPTKRLATLLQPVHVEACDLNSDGLTDLVVADIGEFNADDSDLGRVVWLKRKPDSEAFQKIVLLDNLSRVSDVQPGDFDGDGDLDLLVGAFGWRNSGRTFLMENVGPSKDHDDGRPSFEVRDLDERHGPVHVSPIDLNHDGILDFVALISQEHEVIEAFLNDGHGNFEKKVIFQSSDPAYGSSGIQLVDLDGDKDTDVLFTNGDSFDRGPKPYHSVQWLENKGGYPFEHHHLCNMPGVLSAKAADFDGDGDLDIIAGALLGKTAVGHASATDTASLVLLKQTSAKNFEPTVIEQDRHVHLSVETGDFNGDGKADFAAGNFYRKENAATADLLIYFNKSNTAQTK